MKTTLMPFLIRAYRGWSDHDGIATRYSTLAAALDGARALSRTDYPLVDLSFADCGMVASRRLVGHPVDRDFTPSDTIGDLS